MNHPSPPPLGDMPPGEFEAHAAEVMEWIARYLEAPERYPVFPHRSPGEPFLFPPGPRSAIGYHCIPPYAGDMGALS
jgi:hypothetical protein